MILFQVLVAISLPAFALASSLSPSRSEALRFNPLLPARSTAEALPHIAAQQLTNAKRLSKGLPLKRPVFRRSHSSRAVPSGTLSHHSSVKGHIQLLDITTGEPVGFIGRTFNDFGEYKSVTASDDRLQVKIESVASGPRNILALNEPNAEYPYMGGITGYSSTDSDLVSGSFNYNYFGGVQQSPSSRPQAMNNSFMAATSISEYTESAIFVYNTDGNITVQWINSDLSTPTTYLGSLDDVLFMTGDMATFEKTFGAHVIWMNLRFMPQ